MASTKFLFWNINRKPLAGLVTELTREHSVDVVILVESRTSAAQMLLAPNTGVVEQFSLAPINSAGVQLYTRFSREFVKPHFETDHTSISELLLPLRSPVVLAAVHLPSKLRWSNDSQLFECVELAKSIRRVEESVGHRRTILVGDFNMNPFEIGLVGAAGLNAVTSRAIASRGTRVVQGREYTFFYNPMWGHFGDGRSATAGTYFYDAAEHVNHYWNVFDQVLLRPELAKTFEWERLQIVQCAGGTALVRPDGKPDARNASDHLPIVFEVEF